MEKWVELAYKLKRDKGISWTNLSKELYKETGLLLEAHKIRDAIRVYEKTNNITYREGRSIVINISDVHVGKKTRSTDFDKISERMKYLFDQSVNIIKENRRNYNINEVHINFLGDIIDNDSLYPTQPHHVDHDKAGHATEQIRKATKLFSELIKDIRKTLKVNISVNCVKGNHGRISKFTNEANNYDIMFYNSLELALSDVQGIKFNISNDFYNVAYVENHGFLLNHGNNIRMYQNIPWYGLVQKTMRWDGSIGYDFDYVIVGHFHSNGEQEWNDKIIFMNGTAVTDDMFPVEFLGLSSSNKYWIFTVSKDNGIEARYKIDLSNV